MIFRRIGVAHLVRAGAIGAAFAMAVSVARRSDTATAGEFFVAVAIIVAAATMGRLGTETTVMRAATGAGVTNHAHRAQFIACVAGTLLFGFVAASAFVAFVIKEVPPSESVVIGMSVVCAVVASGVGVLEGALLKGSGFVSHGIIVEMGIAPTLTSFVVALGGPSQSLQHVIVVYSIACVIQAVAGVVVARRGLTDCVEAELPPPWTPTVISNHLSIAVTTTVFYLLTWLPVLMLGFLSTSSEAAIFSVAARLSGFLSLPASIQESINAPRIASAFNAGDRATASSICMTMSRVSLALSAIPGLFLIVAPGLILSLFGSDYSSSATVQLRLLSASSLLILAIGPVNSAMLMTGLERFSGLLAVACALISAFTLAVVVPEWGSVGGAAVHAVIMPLYAIGAMAVVASRSRFSTTALGKAGS